MGYQLELRHLKYFLAVAEDLHFRKAAERLFISQPGLSRQIRQMEEDLGITLFERHNRKVRLTKAGEYLQKELTRNLNNIDRIISYAKLINDGVNGELRLGYVGSAMQKLIPDLLLHFTRKHPNVTFSLNEMENKQQIHALLNEEIDIGFVRIERVPRGLNIHPLFEDTFSLVLPREHKLDEKNLQSISQLKDEPFILFNASYSESYYEKVMQIFDSAGFAPIVSHYTVNAASIFRLVENGFGISIIPTALKYGYNMEVKFVELKNIHQRTTLKVVWNTDNSNPALKDLINIIRDFSKTKKSK